MKDYDPRGKRSLAEITVDTGADLPTSHLVEDPVREREKTPAVRDPRSIPGVMPASALRQTPPKPAQRAVEREYAFSRLLYHVTVCPWPQKYNFYQRFVYDAERFFGMRGEPCRNVPYFSYIPQYAQLNQEQLRCYLYFRERARRFEYDESVDFPYILLYIYEIINLPHRVPPQEGIRHLAGVWLACRRRFPELDKYLAEWVCDYCFVHDVRLPDSLVPILHDIIRIASLKEFYISAVPARADGLLLPPETLLAALSDYNYRASRYYEANAAVFDRVIPQAVCDAVRKAGLITDESTMRKSKTERDAFCGSLCAQTVKRRITVEYYSFAHSYELRQAVTAAVKTAENYVRRDLKIKSRLNVSAVDPAVQEWLRQHFAVPAAAAKPKAEDAAWEKYYEAPSEGIDFRLAGAIEAESWQNTELLVTEEESPAAALPESAPEPESEPAPEAASVIAPDPEKTEAPEACALPPREREALRAVLDGEPLAEWCRRQKEKVLPARIAGGINEIAVDLLGDVLFEETDGWQLIEEYRREAAELVR